MIIEVNSQRYARAGRAQALKMLEDAQLKPDKLIAHRDRTFTAKYEKGRAPLFGSLAYEARMEQNADQHLAIFKRPSPKLDRGPYITLRFSFVDTERLGIAPETSSNGHHRGDLALIIGLMGLARDMKQLTHYVHEEIAQNKNREHALIALKELEKNLAALHDGLDSLLAAQ